MSHFFYQKENLEKILSNIPNIPHLDVPLGKDENHNELIKEWGEIPQFEYHPLDHVDLGEQLNGLDFKTGVKISGSRFVLLRGHLALLERALSSFMIDTHLNNLNLGCGHIIRSKTLYKLFNVFPSKNISGNS